MQRRLIACGARPINNIVDITNYVLFELGQPLHAFDFSRLAGGLIEVRRAKADEPITTLDGVERRLGRETLVIADAERAVAVAGIMGGAGSEVAETTRAVLLESAQFDPALIRRTSRAIGLGSESSYRFERGVDPEGVEAASERAAALIAEFAGGRGRAAIDAGRRTSGRTVIAMDARRLNRWLGATIPAGDIRTTLVRASCRVAALEGAGAMRVTVPSFRPDLRSPVDLYEEVARLTGYDALPASVPSAPVAGEVPPGPDPADALRDAAAGLGLMEAITWALVSGEDLAVWGRGEDGAVKLSNPLSQDVAFLRPSLLIGLAKAVRENLSRGAAGVRLFELGEVFAPGPRPERSAFAIALAGEWAGGWRHRLPADLPRLKGLIEALVRQAGRGARLGVERDDTLAWAEPGHGLRLLADGVAVGAAGLLHAAVAARIGIDSDLWLAELDAAALELTGRSPSDAQPPPAFPPVKRDLSLCVPERVTYAEVDGAIREAAGPLASRVELIDRYVGPQLAPGTYSLTFSLEYRDPSRTLTAAEADELHRRVTASLAGRLGTQLR